MALIDGRTVKWAEYIPEVTMGTTPTNPTMVAFPGDIIDIDVQSGPEMESYPALKGSTDTDPLSCGKSVKTGETHKVVITIKPSGLTWLPFVLLGTTNTTYAPGKVAHPVSIGLVAGTEFCLLKGCVLESAVLEFKDTKTAAVLVLAYIGMTKTAWSSTDYKGTGSHATAPTAAPYTMASIINFMYDGSAPSAADIYMESLKVSITNDMAPVFDLSSSLASKIADYSFNSRSLGLDIGISLTGMGIQNSVLAGTDHTIVFTLGTKTFTFTQVYWTNAPSVKLGPAAKVGMTLTSDGKSTRIAIA